MNAFHRAVAEVIAWTLESTGCLKGRGMYNCNCLHRMHYGDKTNFIKQKNDAESCVLGINNIHARHRTQHCYSDDSPSQRLTAKFAAGSSYMLACCKRDAHNSSSDAG